MRGRSLPIIIAFACLLSACGLLPRAAPYDPTIEQTVTAFDKAFQAHVVAVNATAGTKAGEHDAYKEFYAKWTAELAHLGNYAVAMDPADTCPLSGQIAEVFQTIAQTGGAAGAAALGGTGTLTELAGTASARVEARIAELEATLSQPAGTLTPEQVARTRAEVARWEQKRARLENVLKDVATVTVAPPEGGCSTLVVVLLGDNFRKFEAVHKAQGTIGLPSRARAPVILMNVAIQNALKVQAVKKQKSQAGLL